MEKRESLPGQINLFAAPYEDLIRILGSAYLNESAAWAGTPTGPTTDVSDPASVGARVWRNVRPKIRQILCGNDVLGRTIDGIQAASASVLIEHLIQLLEPHLVLPPTTTRIIAIIYGRTLQAAGRASICAALESADDAVFIAATQKESSPSPQPGVENEDKRVDK